MSIAPQGTDKTRPHSPYIEDGDLTDKPIIVLHPGRRFGEATVGISRLPAWILADFIAAGDSVDSVADAYEIHREFVLLACWYEARYGRRRFRSEWREWLTEDSTDAFWHGDYSRIPDPPAFLRKGKA